MKKVLLFLVLPMILIVSTINLALAGDDPPAPEKPYTTSVPTGER
jgi:hypothetical protein